MFIIIYLTFVTIIFGFLGIMWTKTGWFDVLIKFTLISNAMFGLFVLLTELGYVVKG